MIELATQVLVANYQPIDRDRLINVIKIHLDRANFLEAGSLEEVKSILSSENVAMVLIDRDLPDFENVTRISELQRLAPTTVFLIVGGRPSRKAVIDSLSAGAQGYLLRDARALEVGEALRTVLSGRIYFPPLAGPDRAEQGGQRALPEASRAPAVKLFTGRQLDVLILMAEGHANKVIGRELNITENTVKIHLRAAFRTLGVHTRGSAIEALVRMNILPDKRPNTAPGVLPDA